MKKCLVCVFGICFVISAAVSGLALGCKGEARKASTSDGAEMPTIIIDAGHGGMDGGASAQDGTMEKDINLAIAKALAAEIKTYPANVVMTREDDRALCEDRGQSIRQKKREDLLKRKEIMEGENTTLAISIHLNSFPQDEKVYGPQVFYPSSANRGTNVSNEGNNAKTYAEAIQKSLEINIEDGREREAVPKNDILLFKNAEVDIVLVECGFLSNSVEREKLKTAKYQQTLAKAIWSGVNEILCLAPYEKTAIIDSANKGQ